MCCVLCVVFCVVCSVLRVLYCVLCAGCCILRVVYCVLFIVRFVCCVLRAVLCVRCVRRTGRTGECLRKTKTPLLGCEEQCKKRTQCKGSRGRDSLEAKGLSSAAPKAQAVWKAQPREVCHIIFEFLAARHHIHLCQEQALNRPAHIHNEQGSYIWFSQAPPKVLLLKLQ